MGSGKNIRQAQHANRAYNEKKQSKNNKENS
jgi:hypothetical protein